MNATMAKKPKPPADPPAPVPSGATNPISYKPSKVVAGAMAEYRGRTEFPPSKSAIIERALREFFKARGIDVPPVGDE